MDTLRWSIGKMQFSETVVYCSWNSFHQVEQCCWIITKMKNTCIWKILIIFFISTACYECRVRERERERVEEIMNAYGELTGDLFTLTVSQDLLNHLNMVAFINTSNWVWQIISSQATKVFSFQLATPVLFASGFLSTISVSSHFSFQCVTTTWLIDRLTCLSFSISRKPV